LETQNGISFGNFIPLERDFRSRARSNAGLKSFSFPLKKLLFPILFSVKMQQVFHGFSAFPSEGNRSIRKHELNDLPTKCCFLKTVEIRSEKEAQTREKRFHW
jgi:hypothetical protein